LDPWPIPTRLNLQKVRTGSGRRKVAGGLAVGLAVGLAGGLVGGLAGGLVGGLVSVRYTVLLLCTRRHTAHWLPWRLRAFLHWCNQAGLIRVAGIGYQFRHRELQDYLAHESALRSTRQAGAVRAVE
jgi:hypothetical protein